MSETLNVRWGTRLVGKLRLDEKARLEFQYDSGWISSEEAVPISLRMPLRAEPFDDEACRVFFANLLPEGNTRGLIARKLGVSEDNDFKLLEALGGDCAGALSIFPEGGAARTEGRYEPISRGELDAMIEGMPRNPLLVAHEDLRLSLAGAQQKIPVYFDGGKFFLPHGAFPSSHILKPAISGYPGIVENEAFCMELARLVGIPVPASAVIKGKRPFYLIERYDRRKEADGKLSRVHQEDFCQALGVGYSRKYEAEGGPGLKVCFGLLAERGSQPIIDKMNMLRWVIFNYLIGNCDAHAKNLSILITRRDYRLSPFYDLLSTRVYGHLSLKFAMKIGGQYREDWVRGEHWQKLAEQAGVGARAVLELCLEMGERLPKLAEASVSAFGARETLEQITKHIASASKKMLAVLKG